MMKEERRKIYDQDLLYVGDKIHDQDLLYVDDNIHDKIYCMLMIIFMIRFIVC
jgi:hypothetical protein